MSHAGSRVGRREHHNRRAILRAGRHLGLEAVFARPRNQVLGERRGHAANGRDADLVDVIEAPELGVDRRQRRCPELEAPGVVVQLERAGVEGELVLVPEPPGNGRCEPPRELVTNVQQHDPRPAEQPLEPAGRWMSGIAPLVKYTCDVATRAVRSSTARAMASTGTETWSGLSTTRRSTPRARFASHW